MTVPRAPEAIAVSLASCKVTDFSAAGAFSAQLAARVLKEGLPPGVMLNVNLPRGKVQGVRITPGPQDHPERDLREEGPARPALLPAG